MGRGGNGFGFLAGSFGDMQFKDNSFQRVPPTTIPAGTVIARGYVDTGDQVLVDKVSYHFRSPKRGEVFVFSTKDTGITGVPVEQGSQHYIKRLVGVPGDLLEVRDLPNPGAVRTKPGELYINGERATEPGIVRVMDEYPKTHPKTHEGYVSVLNNRLVRTEFDLTDLSDRRYVAMGDNSSHSADSRSWGTVPEVNVVGPAFVVYWPFKHHWGKIR